MRLTSRVATLDDLPLLARLNHQLTVDEKHANQARPLPWFAQRMAGFLAAEYTAILFAEGDETVADALYRPHAERDDTLYLRQLYVKRGRRRQGVGREAVRLLREKIWPHGKRVTVEVLAANAAARAFWGALGFTEHSLELEARTGPLPE